MSTTIFWDVDTQADFIYASGRLAVPGAEAIIASLQTLTDHAHANTIRIVATADDHDVGHAEIVTPDLADWKSTFPPHCMRSTTGQRKIPETAPQPDADRARPLQTGDIVDQVSGHRGDILLNKPGLDVFQWNPNATTVLDALRPDRSLSTGLRPTFASPRQSTVCAGTAPPTADRGQRCHCCHQRGRRALALHPMAAEGSRSRPPTPSPDDPQRGFFLPGPVEVHPDVMAAMQRR